MVVLLVGVCVTLWGREGDEDECSEEKFIEIVKCCHRYEKTCLSIMPRIDEEVDVEMQSAGKAKVVVGLS